VRTGTLAAILGDWRKRFDSALVERVDEVNGQRSARVRLVRGEAPAITLHVDLATGDILRADVSEIVDGAGTFQKTLTFEDWQEHEGLRLPMRVVSEDDATGKVVTQYRTTEWRIVAEGEPFSLRPVSKD
jgi:hypothetical protein